VRRVGVAAATARVQPPIAVSNLDRTTHRSLD